MSYSRSQNLNPGESEEPLCMLLLPLGPHLLKPWKLVLVWLGIPGGSWTRHLSEPQGNSWP